VIEAPDGEMLSTCDKRKAEWYLCRDLGKLIISQFALELDKNQADKVLPIYK
jgi:hypothetical protein